ncbi:MAG: polyprenyl synthetase family protein [Clostridiales bacterium]|nr:polyprenyl synthetase family protein [Clostridiales bacterium]
MKFEIEYNKLQTIIVDRLYKYLDIRRFGHLSHSQSILEIMDYSLFSGGKRIRPVLLLAAHKMVGGNIEESLPLACAIEMIHNYSLVHDDLPAMDNDDYRRGKPTTHVVYGEDMAILAGDALLNMAYEIMIENAYENLQNIEGHIKAMHILAKAAGIEGMISGQVADLKYENETIDADGLEFIHRYKTGAIINACVLAGVALEGIDSHLLKAIKTYGYNIGLAFQITDDILDIEGSFDKLGKEVGSDERNKKNTFPLLHGLDYSKIYVNELITEALDSLKEFGEDAYFLNQLALSIIDRQY